MNRRTKVLPLLLAGAIGLGATAAGAVNDDKDKPSKGTRGNSALWDEIQDGKAKKVHRPGPERHTTAVWDGCKFHYLKTKVERYEETDGAMGEVSTDPDPMPAEARNCRQYRDPTPEEMADSRARVAAANAGEQGPVSGLPPPPPPPIRK